MGDVGQLALGLQRSVGSEGVAAHVLRLDLNATKGAHWAIGDDRDSWQAAASWRAPLGPALVHTAALERKRPVIPS